MRIFKKFFDKNKAQREIDGKTWGQRKIDAISGGIDKINSIKLPTIETNSSIDKSTWTWLIAIVLGFFLLFKYGLKKIR